MYCTPDIVTVSLTPNGRAHPLCEAQRSKVGRSVFLGFVVIFQSYYYFSSSVSFCQIPDSLMDLTQPVTPVDDRCYLSGLHEVDKSINNC
jgi:hypothetical protein